MRVVQSGKYVTEKEMPLKYIRGLFGHLMTLMRHAYKPTIWGWTRKRCLHSKISTKKMDSSNKGNTIGIKTTVKKGKILMLLSKRTE